MPLQVEVVTAEREVLTDMADMVIAPSVQGIVGILPRHAPMVALMKPGELRLKKGADERNLVVTGGFLQVEPHKVVVLADAAERAEEIDEERARLALERARQTMAERKGRIEMAAAQAALERALVRLRVAERRRRPRGAPQPHNE
ncbi:MAG: F0F1 ATP synthase subunit epsilon [Chloroflexota bacterium]|nr:F0F1 ATP synthase subunit epsilon [Chloroflexota bacterium]